MKRRILWLILPIIALLFAFNINRGVSAATGVELSIQVPDKLNAGDTVTVPIILNATDANVNIYQFELHFDSSKLEMINYDSSNIVNIIYATGEDHMVSQTATGEITFMLSPNNPSLSIPSGQILYEVKFKAKQAVVDMDSVYSFKNMLLVDSNYTPYSATTSVNILSTDATLKTLVPTTGTLSPTFTAGVTSYTMNVPYEVSSVKFTVAANSGVATVTGITEKNLNVGVTEVFEFIVTSQYGNKQTYKVNVTRQASTDNNLKSLSINGVTLSPAFSPNVTEYTATKVPNSTTNVTVSATASSNVAIVSGAGNVSLKTGQNTITITVKAQSGATKTYTIKIEREKNADNTLKSLTVSAGTLSPKFASTTINYTVNVPYATKSITLTATKNNSTATVSGDTGVKNLNVGENTFKINVTAENGTVKTYTVKVTRDAASQNLNIKTLKPKNNSALLSPVFSNSVNDYKMTVPYTVSTLDFEVVLEDTKCTYKMSKPTSLKAGADNVYTITVTSEDGTKSKVVKIIVHRTAAETESTLSSLVPSSGELSPAFSPDITVYELLVEMDVEMVDFSWVSKGKFSTVTLSDDVEEELILDRKHIFTVTVTAQNGTEIYYVINVTRVSVSDNNYLSSLTVYDALIDFDKEKLEYNFTVPKGTTTPQILWDLEDETASARFDGDTTLKPDITNIINIIVTAENGDERVYTLNISFRDEETDSTLSEIVPSYGELDFSSDKTQYTMTVPFIVDKLDFTYKVSGVYATAVYIAPDSLEAGCDNVYNITVTADDGTKTIYEITVYRNNKSSDTTLSKLEINNGVFEPSFDASIREYIVTVPYTYDNIEIVYLLNCEFASAEFIGDTVLYVGENVFEIRITAEDLSTGTYKITVIREEISNDSSLKYMITDKGEIIPEFSADIFEYNMTVPYSIDSVILMAEVNHIMARLEILAPEFLAVGENMYSVTVTAEDLSVTVYTLVVTRLDKETDSKLSGLVPSVGEIDFSPDVLNYEITIAHNIPAITFEYELSGKYSVAEFIGEAEIAQGEVRDYIIRVTAEDGSQTEYVVKVTRLALSDDVTLSNLIVDGVSIQLIDGVFEYNVMIGYTQSSITLEAMVNDPKATFVVSKLTDLIIGSNEVTVTVTAEDQSIGVYRILVERDAGSFNAYLKELKPSVGVFNEEFDKKNLIYTMTVDGSIEKIDFTIATDDEKSTYKLTDTTLRPGDNIITVDIVSENGTMTIYKIVVTRDKKTFLEVINTTAFEVGPFKVSFLILFGTAIPVLIALVSLLIFVIRKEKRR